MVTGIYVHIEGLYHKYGDTHKGHKLGGRRKITMEKYEALNQIMMTMYGS